MQKRAFILFAMMAILLTVSVLGDVCAAESGRESFTGTGASQRSMMRAHFSPRDESTEFRTDNACSSLARSAA